ncbi:hypothetical protein [Bifidobacterium sp. ESL0790]|uniref:hypothetical protein n=1 Tax=Bifidobacterium sp. ESL0790 TaxID=2983233 RepID=UPI0023F6225D|nr:hypothetical protein [Bifidobacterium sp. ESL0790]WEV72059.1 hypothetical protein OZY47_06350 [Bifidobacterium sp. ESL0790]
MLNLRTLDRRAIGVLRVDESMPVLGILDQSGRSRSWSSSSRCTGSGSWLDISSRR